MRPAEAAPAWRGRAVPRRPRRRRSARPGRLLDAAPGSGGRTCPGRAVVVLWAGLRFVENNGAWRGWASGGGSWEEAGAASRSAVPLQLRPPGEAHVLAVAAVIPPRHLVSFVPEYFVQVYFKQEYDIFLLIGFLKQLWLLHVTDESAKIKSPEKRQSSLKWVTSERMSRKWEAPPGNGA